MRVMSLAVSVVTKGGAGVFKGDGVTGVAGGEGVASDDGGFH